MNTDKIYSDMISHFRKENQSFQDYLNEASEMFWSENHETETKPIMIEESERIELETVKTIELLSNYETHLKENYQIEIPEEAMVRFLEK